MAGSNSKHSSTPFPLGQRQLPVPFILPQQLGPLPLPDRQPSTTALQGDWTHAVPPTPEQYRYHGLEARPPPNWRNGKSRDDLSQIYQVTSTSARGLDYRLNATYPSATLLPPPVSMYPGLSSSSRTRQPSDQAPAPRKERASLKSSSSTLDFWAHSTRKSQEEYSGVLRNHDSGVVRYRRGRCPETFGSNGALKKHNKLHLERNYQCSCGAAYTKVSILRVSSTGYD